MKILVVDDSRAMRRIVSRTIRQAGFTGHDIVEAENGQEALEVAERLIDVEPEDPGNWYLKGYILGRGLGNRA